MNLPIIYHPDARQEFDEAYDCYEQSRLGLGEAFADRVEYYLDRILANPHMHSEVMPGIRKCVVRRFPYILIYRVEVDCIHIIAVFHTSRDSAIWQSRV